MLTSAIAEEFAATVPPFIARSIHPSHVFWMSVMDGGPQDQGAIAIRTSRPHGLPLVTSSESLLYSLGTWQTIEDSFNFWTSRRPPISGFLPLAGSICELSLYFPPFKCQHSTPTRLQHGCVNKIPANIRPKKPLYGERGSLHQTGRVKLDDAICRSDLPEPASIEPPERWLVIECGPTPLYFSDGWPDGGPQHLPRCC